MSLGTGNQQVPVGFVSGRSICLQDGDFRDGSGQGWSPDASDDDCGPRGPHGAAVGRDMKCDACDVVFHTPACVQSGHDKRSAVPTRYTDVTSRMNGLSSGARRVSAWDQIQRQHRPEEARLADCSGHFWSAPAGPVRDQPTRVLGEKPLSRLTPPRPSGRPFAATRMRHSRNDRYSPLVTRVPAEGCA